MAEQDDKAAKAIELILAHDRAVAKVLESDSATAASRLERAEKALFVAIVGRNPTPEELKKIS